MAKKSFKKGVQNIIDSIDSQENKKEKKTKIKQTVPQHTPPSKTKTMVINLGASFMVQNSVNAKKKLDTALKIKGKIDITSEPITNIDISFIQILMAFKKEAEAKKLKLNWNLQYSEEIKTLLLHTGMCNIMKQFEKAQNQTTTT